MWDTIEQKCLFGAPKVTCARSVDCRECNRFYADRAGCGDGLGQVFRQSKEDLKVMGEAELPVMGWVPLIWLNGDQKLRSKIASTRYMLCDFFWRGTWWIQKERDKENRLALKPITVHYMLSRCIWSYLFIPSQSILHQVVQTSGHVYVGIELSKNRTMHLTTCIALSITPFVIFDALHEEHNASRSLHQIRGRSPIPRWWLKFESAWYLE